MGFRLIGYWLPLDPRRVLIAPVASFVFRFVRPLGNFVWKHFIGREGGGKGVLYVPVHVGMTS